MSDTGELVEDWRRIADRWYRLHDGEGVAVLADETCPVAAGVVESKQTGEELLLMVTAGGTHMTLSVWQA